MKAKRIIGVALLLAATAMVIASLVLKHRVYRAFESARDEALLTADGRTPGEAGTFRVSYRFSHGTTVSNAEPVAEPDADTAEVQFIREGQSLFLRFREGGETRTGGAIGSTTRVVVKSPFEGDMVFRHGVCGCENIGPAILVYAAIGLSVVLSVIALFLIEGRDRSGPGVRHPN